MKIIVTGGAGFIGSNVVDLYIKNGYTVLIVDNLSTGKKENINRKAKFVNLDIRSPKLKKVILDFKPDVINHIAAQIDVRKSVTDPIFNAEVNDLGTLNLLESAILLKKKPKIIFSSTGGAIYGEVKDKNGADESHSQLPISPYAITKRTAEMYLHFYHAIYGLTYSVLRYGNVYGKRQDPLGEAGVIAIFCGKLIDNETPLIFGSGKQERDYLFVEDIARANLLAIKKGDNKIFNIGTGVGTSVNQLFAILKKISGFSGKAKYMPKRLGELDRSILNAKKAKKELGWVPKFTIEEGLKKTFDWQKGVA